MISEQRRFTGHYRQELLCVKEISQKCIPVRFMYVLRDVSSFPLCKKDINNRCDDFFVPYDCNTVAYHFCMQDNVDQEKIIADVVQL